jgi:hypothetical protein
LLEFTLSLQKNLLMPIYEFYSPGTRKIYSFFARSLSYAEKTPFCPDGKKHLMKKLLSGFSITGGTPDDSPSLEGLEDPGDPFSGMDPNQAEGVMKELEGAMSGMDDENPDPRQMGQLMRKMCEMTGEQMDEPMEEVVRKLEEGMDPDVLEERMGDFTGGEEGDGPLEQERGSTDDAKAKLRSMMSKRLSRDPELYEFSDYIAE